MKIAVQVGWPCFCWANFTVLFVGTYFKNVRLPISQIRKRFTIFLDLKKRLYEISNVFINKAKMWLSVFFYFRFGIEMHMPRCYVLALFLRLVTTQSEKVILIIEKGLFFIILSDTKMVHMHVRVLYAAMDELEKLRKHSKLLHFSSAFITRWSTTKL